MTIVGADPPPWLAAAIDALPPEVLPNFRLEGPAAIINSWLSKLLQASGLLPGQAWIVGDIAAKASLFANTTGTMVLALKLEVVCDNACRKLHHDCVANRLVCTYRGPGTQWLPHAHEAALGDERDAVPDDWLLPVPRFAAALFTGVLSPGARPVLHRSPPIAGTSELRLVLTINEPFTGRFRGRT